MSRSYKKNAFGSYYAFKSNKKDKIRTHKSVRHNSHEILNQQLKLGTSIFLPYEDTCFECWRRYEGYYCDDPSEYVIDYDKSDNAYSKPYTIRCAGCWDSENPNNHHDYDYWEQEPADLLVNNRLDRSLPHTEKAFWKSEGKWFMADKSSVRKDYECQVFTFRYRSVWKDYMNSIEFGPYQSYWFIMDFLMTCRLVPKTFTEKEQLIDWMRQHQEYIISTWYRIKYLRK